MKRRTFISAAAAAPLLATLPGRAFAQHLPFNPRPGAWRDFEVVTHVDVVNPSGISRAWIPLPSVDGDYQRSGTNSWSGNATRAEVLSDGTYGASMLYAEWKPGETAPAIEVTSRFSTRDRATDFSRPNPALALDASTRAFYTAPSILIPTDGIVRETATKIVAGRKTDMDKARAIYDWVVENTERDPKTRGCGTGDVKFMLENKALGGKCADLNALYVGLARSVGVPARDVYGVRVAKSAFGYSQLGAGNANVTGAQHCRAEVFLTGFGWVPVDPADVRKVMLAERSKPVSLDDPLVPPVRQALFGGWEGNWLAYNVAHDVKLPHSAGPAVGFLMYPQLETGSTRRDSLDPANFKYRITAHQV